MAYLFQLYAMCHPLIWTFINALKEGKKIKIVLKLNNTQEVQSWQKKKKYTELAEKIKIVVKCYLKEVHLMTIYVELLIILILFFIKILFLSVYNFL